MKRLKLKAKRFLKQAVEMLNAAWMRFTLKFESLLKRTWILFQEKVQLVLAAVVFSGVTSMISLTIWGTICLKGKVS
jgi:hypothetical protein